MKRNLRAVFRLSRVAIHLGYGAGIAATVFPFASAPLRRAMKRRWSRQLVGMLGLRLEMDDSRPPLAGLLVANHISWLDVFVINAVQPVAFVAKDDVAAWPLIGWLAARNDTVFLRRGSHRAAHILGQQVAAMLASGVAVAVFPEGTTTDGEQLLPFRGALLQGAIDVGATVQPVALRYVSESGERSTAAAYCGDTSLLTSLWWIASASGLTVGCLRLAPVETNAMDRRQLAEICAAQIRAALGLETPRSAEQHQSPRQRDIDQRYEHGGAADVLGTLGEAVAFE